jgi:hypothetical protein
MISKRVMYSVVNSAEIVTVHRRYIIEHITDYFSSNGYKLDDTDFGGNNEVISMREFFSRLGLILGPLGNYYHAKKNFSMVPLLKPWVEKWKLDYLII